MKYIEISGEICIESGLHIGAGNDEIRIGGIDNPVVKNPITGEPYIPGSSLKGKVRCLLEQVFDAHNNGSPSKIGKIEIEKSFSKKLICEMFGNGGSDREYNGKPTRLMFRDSSLINKEIFPLKGIYTEGKYEVVIDRSKGTAKDGGIRQVERVPAGAKFDFRVVMKVFKDDDTQKMISFLKLGLKLLEMDCLGGSGSRGYGRIKFEGLKLNDELFDWEDITYANLTDKIGEFTRS